MDKHCGMSIQWKTSPQKRDELLISTASWISKELCSVTETLYIQYVQMIPFIQSSKTGEAIPW